MDQKKNNPKICYLAPEIPALSATFVYEELLSLEKKGVVVLPVSVHYPGSLAKEQQALEKRVIYLYPDFNIRTFLSAFRAILKRSDGKITKPLKWLVSDIFELGVFRLSSWKLVYQFLVSITLADSLQKNKCKHLHVHFAHVPAQIAMYASAMTGIPFSVTAHANDIFERGLLLQKKADRAKKFLTISDYNRTFLLEEGLDEKKLGIVRCAADFSDHQISNKPVGEVFKIGTLGRLVEKKGVDVLIEAVALLSSKGLIVDLEIAGDGPLHDELQAQVGQLGLSESVKFIGALRHDGVASWMQQLDIFVLACKKDRNGDQDGIPVVLMEAMALGIPVVSTKISGIPELIRDNETGLLAEPADAVSLSEKIERLVLDHDAVAGLKHAAKLHVEQEFGREVNTRRLLAIFDL